jgi:hypothetical protein
LPDGGEGLRLRHGVYKAVKVAGSTISSRAAAVRAAGMRRKKGDSREAMVACQEVETWPIEAKSERRCQSHDTALSLADWAASSRDIPWLERRKR